MRLKLALLDLNNGTPNQGIRCLKEILEGYEHVLDWEIFDVRAKCEIPDTGYDIYLSSGGPGSPLDGDGVWDVQYYDLIDQIWDWNLSDQASKKYVFFICHSFQMVCNHFKLGSIVPRKSMSFGTFPVHKTEAGAQELVFDGLNDPFYAADFRRWQFIQPDLEQFEALGASILALEKIRPHVPLERAIMAVRFSPEMIGVQFHPEADADGMIEHFKKEELKKEIIRKHGKDKYNSLMCDLSIPKRIEHTHNTVIPNFMEDAITSLLSMKQDKVTIAMG
ncbi:MAG: GMP synthase [Bacteroidota bacterium]